MDDRGSERRHNGSTSPSMNHFPTHRPPSNPTAIHTYHHHRGSITSVGSDSTDSSPTTTISTFDSASVTASTDPSPSSSPESPTSTAPISPFKNAMNRPATVASEQVERDGSVTAQLSPLGAPRPGSPGNKARNVKNLSLNVLPSPSAVPAESPALDSSQPLSAPTSPLRPPQRTVRRKPTNLTIQTPSFDQATFASAGQGPIPPTPSNRHSLRHFESSPSLQSMFSPTSLPPGGMQFPRPVTGRQPSSSAGSYMMATNRENQDIVAPVSQETVERGYTSGPIRVYDAGLYLYLEPTEEEAAKFDVIVNVAKEVKNPFTAARAPGMRPSVTYWRNGDKAGVKQSVSEPQTALSERSFKSAFEWPNPDGSGASKTSPATGPEYIHVPWDHNSEILDDLYPLCQLIDRRIEAGKSVLIHCQLGVSRSASLVIAYGLYKKYHPDFHSMYTAVKERSRWVGPNMSLIYQLMDFRAKMVRNSIMTPDATDNLTTPARGPLEPERTPKAVSDQEPLLPLVKAPSNMVSIGVQTDFEPFYSLPLPAEPSSSSISHSAEVDEVAKAVSAEPAAVSFSNVPTRESAAASARRVAPRPLPLRQTEQTGAALANQPASRDFLQSNGNGQAKPAAIQRLQVHPSMQDVPPTPSVFSPRAAEFLGSPFRRTIAGDLAFSPTIESSNGPSFWDLFDSSKKKGPQEEDPRSPHQPDQVKEIIRSIDELL